ncbi:L-threonylcarbamoyladenylate synthase, partial [Bdellovibrionota bacterium FG-1]
MRARILSSTPDHIALVAQAIQHDEVVGMPTETVYGLAGGAFQPEALARIFETKERPTFDPLIVHVGTEARNLKELEKLRLVNISLLSPIAYQRIELLIERFWPGPLTLVLPKQDAVPDLATSGLPSVALRMPAHPVAQALIAAAGTPLAAPSANRFGRISPTTAQAVADELGDRIDWIINGGHCQVGVESTVLRIEVDGRLTLLRPGGIARDQIEKIGPWTVEIEQPSSNPIAAGMLAPGMLDSHYAPSKPMFMLPATIPHLEAQHWEEI